MADLFVILKKCRLVVLVILSFLLHQSSGLRYDDLTHECSSRVYCKSNGIKFMSLSKLSGVYLNTTTISTTRTDSFVKCQTQCLNAQRCFSINMNTRVSNDYECQLLSGSIYSSAPMLVKNADFVHLYIKGACESGPCQNDGVCIPEYSNDTYTCQCKVNGTFKGSGRHCEIVARGFDAADHYWPFDQLKENLHIDSRSSTHVRFLNKGTLDQILPELGRNTPVLYLRHKANGKSPEMCSSVDCMNNLRGCENGMTLSVWIRFTRYELGKSRQSHIYANTAFASSSSGFIFYAKPNRADGYFFGVQDGTHRWELLFGHNILAQKWTQFVMTYQKGVGICAYIDGKLDRCGGTSTSKSTTHAAPCIRLGYESLNSHTSDLYMDDLAIWKFPISAAAVKELYDYSKV